MLIASTAVLLLLFYGLWKVHKHSNAITDSLNTCYNSDVWKRLYSDRFVATTQKVQYELKQTVHTRSITVCMIIVMFALIAVGGNVSVAFLAVICGLLSLTSMLIWRFRGPPQWMRRWAREVVVTYYKVRVDQIEAQIKMIDTEVDAIKQKETIDEALAYRLLELKQYRSVLTKQILTNKSYIRQFQ